MSNNQRSFRIVAVSHDDGISFEDGIYHGRGPGQAALKAFNWYCRKSGLQSCKRRFSIEDITRGRSRKQFHYVGTRKQLAVPKIIERDGENYLVQYSSKILKAS
uniref:Uncharacterized protein n=1 Tax=Marseillevirus LCMAC201 TaxID=2506605 RepID=A0A481YWS9_9VIRU|nr:MAG: hypothetical protein LCMAC201_01470 [Marseillevirus LCMAC201]